MAPSHNMLGNPPPSPRHPASQDRCDQDVYSLFGDSADGPIGVLQQPIVTQDGRLPRIFVTSRRETRQSPADRQRTRRQSDASEAPFSGGICRQLAAMYTDVGMTTVERVRWLCGWMVLVYALTCWAWFALPTYSVPVVGILTGTIGLLACQRPHEQSYMVYVLAFTALNYAQMAQLVWLVFITLSAELATTCIDHCANETKAVFIVLQVIATGIFHWRVVTATRQYVREFRMIEQLANWGSDAYINDASYSHATASSTTETESSVSGVSVSVVVDSEHQLTTTPYAYNPL